MRPSASRMAWASDEFWSRDRNLASRPRRSAASSTSRPFWLASVRDVGVERAPQHQEQHGRGQPRHDEHVPARRLDELDDRGRVLVDLVGPDHRPVRRADRQVDLEVVVGQVAVELVLLGVRAAEVELAGGLAVEGLHEVVVDVEGAAAQGGRSENRIVPPGDHSLIRAIPPGCTSRSRSASMSRPDEPSGSPIVASASRGSTLARTVVSALRAASIPAASVTRWAASSAVTNAAPSTSTEATTSTAGRSHAMSRWLRESSETLRKALRMRVRSFKKRCCPCRCGAGTQR